MAKKKSLPSNLQAWDDARKRHRLAHAHVQMARELGMNPQKLGGLDNADQEPWKAPLPAFIESLYVKRFGKPLPDAATSIEERFRAEQAKKAARKAAKRQLRAAGAGPQQSDAQGEGPAQGETPAHAEESADG
jgi:hypothetical protein